MKSTILKIGFSVLILSLVTASAFAQGRGRGRNQDRKCSVFVNCHDARDGRWDGRGPNRMFARGANVGYRHRYNMNDYWQRRHLTYRTSDLSNRWRYHNRTWRNR